MNNTTYFNYMEDARIDVFRIFVPNLDLQKWNMIVASTRCDFLAQVTYAEQLNVFTWISKIGNTSFVVDHAIQNARGTWVARGQATLIAYDYRKQTAIPLWPEVREALAQHMDGPENAPNLRG